MFRRASLESTQWQGWLGCALPPGAAEPCLGSLCPRSGHTSPRQLCEDLLGSLCRICSPPGRICHRSGDASGGTTGEEGRRPFRVATRTGAHRGADRVCREGGHGLNANLDCHATRCHTRFIVLAGAVSGCMLR